MTAKISHDQSPAHRLHGSELLKRIAKLVQIAKLYEDNNKLTINAVNSFKAVVHKLSNGSEHTSLQVFNGHFYLQEAKLPMLRKDTPIFKNMYQFLEKRGLCGFHFDGNLEEVPAPEILAFARFLNTAIMHPNPTDWIKAELEKWDIHWLAVIEEPTLAQIDEPDDEEAEEAEAANKRVKAAKKTYNYALGSVKEVAAKLISGKEAGIRKSVRMVQRMVDLIEEDDRSFFALSTIRMYDDYTFTHSLNVALLAMSLGKRIGMKPNTLERLGLCGMFHDLGKILVPKQILNKKGKLTDSEFEEIKKHSVNSALLILKLKTDKYRKMHLFVAPFEHHIRYDHSGYPLMAQKRPVSLFGRILTIVDVYDAITSPRIYRNTSMSPDKALGLMMKDSGTHFDPVLLKAFVNMLGVYPVGTLLKLDTGEMGLVLDNSSDPRGARPMVQLLDRNQDNQYVKVKVINLAERDHKSRKYKRNIVATEHAASLGIQPAHFML